MQTRQTKQHRESIWSVPEKWRATYFVIFTILSTNGLITVIADQQIPPPDGRWDILIVDIVREMALIGAGSAITAITITELGRYIMVIAEWMLREVIEPRQRRRIERWRKEGIEEGIQEGVEQGDKEWEEWLSRKMQAEANGEVFDEPMPSQLRNNTDQ